MKLCQYPAQAGRAEQHAYAGGLPGHVQSGCLPPHRAYFMLYDCQLDEVALCLPKSVYHSCVLLCLHQGKTRTARVNSLTRAVVSVGMT